jgi:hypothetical protein
VLHNRWKSRQIESGRVWPTTLALIALGILLTFPPVWTLL